MPNTTTTTIIDVEQRVVRPVEIKLNGGGRGNGAGRKGGGGGNNNGGGGGSGGSGGSDNERQDNFSPLRYWIGIYITLAAVLMTFATMVVAYVARAVGSAGNWHPVEMPRLLWLSTALILASSAAFEIARRNIKRGDGDSFQRWLSLTLLLGLGFLASQLAVFRQLLAQGISFANNLHSAFFYLLTGTHGLHLLGGITALSYLLLRQRKVLRLSTANGYEAQRKQRTISDVVALYWHFIDGLWLFLFALLFLWK